VLTAIELGVASAPSAFNESSDPVINKAPVPSNFRFIQHMTFMSSPVVMLVMFAKKYYLASELIGIKILLLDYRKHKNVQINLKVECLIFAMQIVEFKTMVRF
jgi:hypothetical protein